ncbi:MAG: hypothetical protein FDZ69_06125 [Deltaproteobacteria bacterium]|nr:MAG: hypothetical protein FDZ69_06125 [Deltaproteobacteria bacterium]
MTLLRFARKQPVWVLAALAGFLLIRSCFAHTAVDPAATDILRRWVIAEVESYHLARTDLDLAGKGALLRDAATIRFAAVNARGTADDMVFRIEIDEHPALPPAMPRVRYVQMRYRMLLGWETAPRQSSALSYFLALFLL